MNVFLGALDKYDIKRNVLRKTQLTTLQVNMGDLCNQSCWHCHIEASPQGKNIMPKKVVDDIMGFLGRHKIETLDITGGAPELNPNFDHLVKSARSLVRELIVRSNLTVFFEPGKKYLPEFFKAYRVHLVCSLPCYTKENVDQQRGKGVFEKSVRALNLLNKIGFAKEGKGLELDLAYNALGAFLPASQGELEKEYKKVLKQKHDIEFNRLLTITNVPIKKFKAYLDSNNDYEKYSRVLEESFNPDTLANLMCRTFLSVGFDGRLYDCDFNLALGFALKNTDGTYLTIDKVYLRDLENRNIEIGEHCLACTAGSGSSCQGALTNGNFGSGVSCPDKKEAVKEYYGKILKGQKDLETNACCSTGSMPEPQKSILRMIEPEILDKFYGCGSPIPPLLSGCNVLDLGCGTGRDVYIASYLVGEQGLVTGVDMTDEQLELAFKYKNKQMRKFAFKTCNVEFKKGYIEDLKTAGIKDNSQDVVISNCVINLSPDKKSVFSEIFRVLKSGGELYFSDIFSGRRIPEDIKEDRVLYGECLGGAMYIEDFRRMLREIGCPDYRIVSRKKLTITEQEIKEKVGAIDFYSITIRVFKLDDLEDICEDYGQVAIYLGSITDSGSQFLLDDRHIFIANKPMLVCGNTASMLMKTRYAEHFKVISDRSAHYGPFKCAPYTDKLDNSESSIGGSCC